MSLLSLFNEIKAIHSARFSHFCWNICKLHTIQLIRVEISMFPLHQMSLIVATAEDLQRNAENLLISRVQITSFIFLPCCAWCTHKLKRIEQIQESKSPNSKCLCSFPLAIMLCTLSLSTTGMYTQFEESIKSDLFITIICILDFRPFLWYDVRFLYSSTELAASRTFALKHIFPMKTLHI